MNLPSSFCDYLREVWPVLSLVAAIAIGAAAGFEASGLPWPVPPWLIWIVCTLILIVANFLTYHRLRVRLLDQLRARRALVHMPPERLQRVHRIRDLAGEVMYLIEAVQDPDAVRDKVQEMERLGSTLSDIRLFGSVTFFRTVQMFTFWADGALGVPPRERTESPYEILVAACVGVLQDYGDSDILSSKPSATP